MCPASYNFCAICIVREGEYPKRELAVCCRVEVVNGAREVLFCSLSFTPFISQDPFLPSVRIFSTNFSSLGSFEHSRVNCARLGVSKSPEILQNFSGTKARI